MSREIKISDEIYFDGLTHFLIKVKNHLVPDAEEEFCYVYTQEDAAQMINNLASTLVTELCDDKDVKSGWAKVFRNDTEREICISKQVLGTVKMLNRSKTLIYTLTYREVPRGYCKDGPVEALVKDMKAALDKL